MRKIKLLIFGCVFACSFKAQYVYNITSPTPGGAVCNNLIQGMYAVITINVTTPVTSILPASGSLNVTLVSSNATSATFILNPTSTTAYNFIITGGSGSQTVPFTQNVVTGIIPTFNFPSTLSGGGIADWSITNFSSLPAATFSFYNPDYTPINSFIFDDFSNSTSSQYFSVIQPDISSSNYHMYYSNATSCGFINFPIIHTTPVCGGFAGYTNIPNTLSGTYSNVNWQGVANGNITVSGAVTINNGSLLLDGTNKIIVPNGAILTLSHCRLKSKCHIFWKGIEVQAGGQLITQNVTFIEDASVGVRLVAGSSGNPDGLFNCSRTVFNANQVAIAMLGLEKSIVDYTSSNMVITCRNIPTAFYFNTNAAFDNYFSSIFDVYNPTLVAWDIQWTQKNTWEGKRSFAGIYIKNVNSPGTSNYDLSANTSSAFRIIDRQDYGVYCTSSDIRVMNYYFYNMGGYLKNGTTPIGVGIYATSIKRRVNSIEINKVFQTNTFIGNHILNYSTINVVQLFQDNKTNYNLSTNINIPGNNFGHAGTTWLQNTITDPLNWNFIRSNIANHHVGLYVNRTVFSSPITLVNISCSRFLGGKTVIAPNANNVRMDQCIHWNDALSSPNPLNGPVVIRTNSAFNFKRNFIAIDNFKENMKIIDGGLTFLNDVGHGDYFPINGVYGDRNKACEAYRIAGCDHITLKQNIAGSCTNNGTVLNPPWTTLNNKGIAIYNSKNTLIKENDLSFTFTGNQIGTCVYFNGSCPGTNFTGNKMGMAKNELFLSNNAIIGTQGSAAVHAGNKFDLTAGCRTRCTGMTTIDPNVFNRIFCFTTALWTPYSLNCSGGSMFSYANASSIGPGLIAVPGGGPPFSGYLTTDCPDAQRTGSTDSLIKDSVQVLSLEKMKEVITYDAPTSDLATRRFENHYMIYSMIKQNNIDVTSEALLKSFMANNANSEIGQLFNMTDAFKKGDVKTAESLNNSYNPSLLVSQNIKFINSVLIKLAKEESQTVLTNSDKSTLSQLATSCADINGTSVLAAQGILNSFNVGQLNIYNQCFSEDSDDENEGDNDRKIKGINSSINIREESTFNIFPNPNNGVYTITYNTNKETSFTLFDINGKLILTQVLSPELTEKIIETKYLDNGVYFYKLSIEGEIKSGKLIILK